MPDLQFRPYKKQPACDPCREKRVLCHPQPNGEPCPRCVTKGYTCITTPRVRRKPTRRKPDDKDESPTTPTSHASTSRAASSSRQLSNQSVDSQLSARQVSTSLVIHLVQEFKTLPQACHPAVLGARLFSELEAVGHHVHFLSPSRRALAYAVMATAAFVSPHPIILGSSPVRASEISLEIGHDLRQFGSDRHTAWEMFRSTGLDLALSSAVLYEPTWDNMLCCILLDMAEYHIPGRDTSKLSRPFGGAHVSHARAIASREGWNPDAFFGTWALFLMSDAVLSIKTGGPILFTPQDSLLLCGATPEPTLEDILRNLVVIGPDITHAAVFTKVNQTIPCITRLCSRLAEGITGVPARRAPLDERKLAVLMKELDTLQFIVTLLSKLIPCLPQDLSTEYPISLLDMGISALLLPWATLVHATYLEVKRRWSLAASDATAPALALEVYLYQVTQLAVVASIQAARRLIAYPWLGYLTSADWTRPDTAASVLLSEQEMIASMGLGLEANEALLSIRDILRLRGWCDPDDGGLIARIERRLNLSPEPPLNPHSRATPIPAAAITVAMVSDFSNVAKADGSDELAAVQSIAHAVVPMEPGLVAWDGSSLLPQS